MGKLFIFLIIAIILVAGCTQKAKTTVGGNQSDVSAANAINETDISLGSSDQSINSSDIDYLGNASSDDLDSAINELNNS